MTNASQTVIGTIAYEGFGQSVGTTGSSSSPYLFAATSGYRNDGDAGLVHVGARYYDAQAGLFLTRDTYLEQKPYLYCEHDPVNYVDPDGHDWLENLSNFSAGMGDTLTFGVTDRIRDWIGCNDVVTKDSGYYFSGQVAGCVESLALGGYLALRPGTAMTQVVTHWGKESPWVMTGGATLRNWVFAGCPKGPPTTFSVPGSRLTWPSGREYLKGLLGQRILH